MAYERPQLESLKNSHDCATHIRTVKGGGNGQELMFYDRLSLVEQSSSLVKAFACFKLPDAKAKSSQCVWRTCYNHLLWRVHKRQIDSILEWGLIVGLSDEAFDRHLFQS